MAETQRVRVTSGGKGNSTISHSRDEGSLSPEYLRPAADLLGEAFKDDPVIRWMTSSMPDSTRVAYLPTYWYTLLNQALLNDAVLQGANDWSCCAVWMLPGKQVDNPLTISPMGLTALLWNIGLGGGKRMLWDYGHQADVCKRKGLRDSNGKVIKRYHYLFVMATDTAHRGKGLASGLLAQYQEQAAKDGLPIWLEATTAASRNIYARCGFETVQEVRMGKGSHAESGAMYAGGPGVPLWAMIWRPSVDAQ